MSIHTYFQDPKTPPSVIVRMEMAEYCEVPSSNPYDFQTNVRVPTIENTIRGYLTPITEEGAGTGEEHEGVLSTERSQRKYESPSRGENRGLHDISGPTLLETLKNIQDSSSEAEETLRAVKTDLLRAIVRVEKHLAKPGNNNRVRNRSGCLDRKRCVIM